MKHLPEIPLKTRQDIAGWLRNQAYTPDTTKSYRSHLENLHRWLLNEQTSFEAMSVDDFLAYLDEQNWGASMRRLSLCAARAYARDHVGRLHPVFEVKIKRPTEKPQRTLTVDEVRRVLEAIDTDKPNGLRDYALVCLLVDTGLRNSEVCRLRLPDLDLDNCILGAQVKGGKHRQAAFTPETANFLRDWLAIRDEYARPDVDRVFVGVYGNTPGGPMTKGGMRAIFRKLAKKAGIPRFSPHALRRTMATIMTGDNHAPERITQIGGGWESTDMVRTYTRALGVESTRPFLAMRAVTGQPAES